MSNYTGCPCGCMTKLPYFDDPDCIRNRDMPPARMAAVAKSLRQLADELAREARKRKKAERLALDELRREIHADIRENGFEARQ